jgi:hypothetical protein
MYQIDHILIHRGRHSSILHVLSFRGADCDTNHYQVIAKVREREAVSKRETRIFNMKRFNLKKQNEVEGKEQHQIKISNRFVALENLYEDVDINRDWETITENIKIYPKRV